MTPGARVQAAIEVLDRVLAGEAAERALTTWGRSSRFAGSKDRAAVRDHVFDALRRLRSAAWAGGLGDVVPEEMNGRAVMAGLLAGQGADVAALFSGQGHAPAPLESRTDPGEPPQGVALDLPDWLLPLFRRAHGDQAYAIAITLRDRAPVTLRANLQKTGRDSLLTTLAEAGHEARLNPLSPSGITLDPPARGLTNLPAFRDGLFEMQDAGSQALVDRLPAADGPVLDLCAGGGGKALALAARGAGPVLAHDADAGRMRDLSARAARAGVTIEQVAHPEDRGPFAGIVADVPCSGSGSWRRAPEAKWRLTEARLTDLMQTQDAILDRAAKLLRPGGWLGYMTCSVLMEENEDRIAAALVRIPGLTLLETWSCQPTADGDGFFLAILQKT